MLAIEPALAAALIGYSFSTLSACLLFRNGHNWRVQLPTAVIGCASLYRAIRIAMVVSGAAEHDPWAEVVEPIIGALFLMSVLLLNLEGREHEALRAKARILKALRQKDAQLAAALERANKAMLFKQRLLRNMNHEFRTPLSGVLGMNELLLDTPLTAEQEKYARSVRESARSLLLLLESVVDYSDMESENVVIQPGPANLKEIVGHVIHLHAIEASEKGIRLNTHFEPAEPPTVLCDSYRLHQVLANVVGNAVKFTKQGRVEIEVAVRPGVDAANTVMTEFTVRDTGIGVASDKLCEIFEGFNQADNSLQRSYGGAGLGLAIARELVELMGGEIHCESRLGLGSNFQISIPLKKSAGPVSEAEAPRVPSRSSFQQKRRVKLRAGTLE